MSRMLCSPGLALVGTITVLLSGFTEAGAQQRPEAFPGDRVRVTTPTLVHWDVEGELLSLSRDSLRVQPAGGGAPVAVPRQSIERLRVSEGRRRATWRGAFIGLFVGFAIGEALVAAERADGTIDPACGELSCRGWPDRLLWTGIGIGAGGLVGSRFHHERWADVPDPSSPGGRSGG